MVVVDAVEQLRHLRLTKTKTFSDCQQLLSETFWFLYSTATHDLNISFHSRPKRFVRGFVFLGKRKKLFDSVSQDCNGKLTVASLDVLSQAIEHLRQTKRRNRSEVVRRQDASPQVF